MKRIWWVLGFVGWGFVAYYASLPTSDFFVLNSVTVTDRFVEPSKLGTRILEIDRDIRQNFTAGYRVEEQALLPDGGYTSVVACESRADVKYRVDKSMPDPLTIDWWKFGDCGLVPAPPVKLQDEGFFRLCTWHFIEVFPKLKKATPGTCSDSYRRRALFVD